MSGLGAIVVILTVLLAAPLALGSYVVVQGASRAFVSAWFGVLTALSLAALVIGAIALLPLLS